MSIENGSAVQDFGTLFYMVNPKEFMYSSPKDVPDFLDKALPYLLLLMLIEAIYNTVVRKRELNISDSITSINFGILMVLAGLGSRMTMISVYSYIHKHYNIIDFGETSLLCWILAAVAIDCGYYWFHRASHEISFLWAVHQAHHSSEEMNLTTAMRQPILEGLGWLTHWFYLPCALFIPTTQMIVHSELNFLYQFWIHTELVGNLGVLEYVFNTASQHRVHHGANRYCIDKNYGGFLSIWDRLFGTFAEEKQDEDIVYGLVDQPMFYNILKLNTFYFKDLHNKAVTFKSLKAWFYGPGWFPGYERLGDVNELPEYPIRQKVVQKLPLKIILILISNLVISLLALDFLSKEDVNFLSLKYCSASLIAFMSAYATSLELDHQDASTVNIARFGILMVPGLFESMELFWQVSCCISTASILLSIMYSKQQI